MTALTSWTKIIIGKILIPVVFENVEAHAAFNEGTCLDALAAFDAVKECPGRLEKINIAALSRKMSRDSGGTTFG